MLFRSGDDVPLPSLLLALEVERHATLVRTIAVAVVAICLQQRLDLRFEILFRRAERRQHHGQRSQRAQTFFNCLATVISFVATQTRLNASHSDVSRRARVTGNFGRSAGFQPGALELMRIKRAVSVEASKLKRPKKPRWWVRWGVMRSGGQPWWVLSRGDPSVRPVCNRPWSRED